MAEKRTKIDIIGDMLMSVIDKGGHIKPTHLMYKSNLSHRQMKVYLEELLQREFVKRTKNKDRDYVTITEKGHDFANKLREIKEFERVFGF
ncbi:hypothetical protein HYT53_03610 [Candidatus Woesearchaeota archaeon]|nr:hypothetical protein [Candidatus Woesearchaeota archaeon]